MDTPAIRIPSVHIKLNWKVVAVVVMAFSIMGASDSCASTPQSISADQGVTDKQMSQYQKVQPVPYFDSSTMRQTLIEILKAQTTPTNTWSVIVALDGTAVFMCPSIGYPIPATDELTNPQQAVVGPGTGNTTVAQADPNGVYAGNTAGTYILCVAPDGQYAPVYSELDVQTFPFPVSIDPTTHRIVVDPNGKSTITVPNPGASAKP